MASVARYDAVVRYFRAEVEAGRIPGAVLLVQRDGEVRCFEAIGLARPGVPMAQDSIFRIWSLTKPMVCAAALLLVEERRLTLDDAVAKSLPAFARMRVFISAPKGVAAAQRVMTIRDLMRHTSGLEYPGFTTNPELKRAYDSACLEPTEISSTEFVDRLVRIPLASEPGSRFAYGYSTDVLGCVIEEVSGMRLGDFLRTRLFDALGMADTGFHLPAAEATRLAQPLARDPLSGAEIELFDPRKRAAMDGGGSRGLSTAVDLARFATVLLGEGQFNGARILGQESVAQMKSNQLRGIPSELDPGELTLGSPGYSYGLGLGVRLSADSNATVPGTAGEIHWTGMFNHLFFVDPTRQLIGLFLSVGIGSFRHEHRRAFKRFVHEAESPHAACGT